VLKLTNRFVVLFAAPHVEDGPAVLVHGERRATVRRLAEDGLEELCERFEAGVVLSVEHRPRS